MKNKFWKKKKGKSKWNQKSKMRGKNRKKKMNLIKNCKKMNSENSSIKINFLNSSMKMINLLISLMKVVRSLVAVLNFKKRIQITIQTIIINKLLAQKEQGYLKHFSINTLLISQQHLNNKFEIFFYLPNFINKPTNVINKFRNVLN